MSNLQLFECYQCGMPCEHDPQKTPVVYNTNENNKPRPVCNHCYEVAPIYCKSTHNFTIDHCYKCGVDIDITKRHFTHITKRKSRPICSDCLKKVKGMAIFKENVPDQPLELELQKQIDKSNNGLSPSERIQQIMIDSPGGKVDNIDSLKILVQGIDADCDICGNKLNGLLGKNVFKIKDNCYVCKKCFLRKE